MATVNERLVNIRVATESDYDLFNNIYKKGVDLGFESTHVDKADVPREDYLKYDTVILAEENGEAIGYAMIHCTDQLPGVCIIYDFYSTKWYGEVTDKLLEVVKDAAKESGLDRLRVDTYTIEMEAFWSRKRFRSVNNTACYELMLNT